MEDWYNGWRFKDKIIVCGHWNTSFGNYKYHHIGSGEFQQDSSFEPFIDEGIIALDACTAYSKKINILVIDENENILKVSKDSLNKHKEAFKKLSD